MKDPLDTIPYHLDDGTDVDVLSKYGDMRVTQRFMFVLFGLNPQNMTKHIANIQSEGELEKPSICSKMEQVQIEGMVNYEHL